MFTEVAEFHQVFTRFQKIPEVEKIARTSPKHSPGFWKFDQVFTKFLNFTRSSQGFENFTRFSPGFGNFSYLSPTFESSPGSGNFTRFSPGSCFAFNFTAKTDKFHKKKNASFGEISKCKTLLQSISPGFGNFTKFSPGFGNFTRCSPGFPRVFTKFSQCFSPGFTSPSFHQAVSGKKAAGFQRSVFFFSCDCEKRKKRFVCSPKSTKRFCCTKCWWIPGKLSVSNLT